MKLDLLKWQVYVLEATFFLAHTSVFNAEHKDGVEYGMNIACNILSQCVLPTVTQLPTDPEERLVVAEDVEADVEEISADQVIDCSLTYALMMRFSQSTALGLFLVQPNRSLLLCRMATMMPSRNCAFITVWFSEASCEALYNNQPDLALFGETNIFAMRVQASTQTIRDL